MTTLPLNPARAAAEAYHAAADRRSAAYTAWYALNEDVAAPISPEWTAFLAATGAAEIAFDRWMALLPTRDWEDVHV